MSRLALFLCYLALGICARLLFVGLSALGRKLHVKPVAVVLDVLFSAVAVTAAAVLAFLFNDGILTPYNIAAALVGFFVAAAIL